MTITKCPTCGKEAEESMDWEGYQTGIQCPDESCEGFDNYEETGDWEMDDDS